MLNTRKKKIILICLLILLGAAIFIYLRSQEDNWIKDEAGFWTKHGQPTQASPCADYGYDNCPTGSCKQVCVPSSNSECGGEGSCHAIGE